MIKQLYEIKLLPEPIPEPGILFYVFDNEIFCILGGSNCLELNRTHRLGLVAKQIGGLIKIYYLRCGESEIDDILNENVSYHLPKWNIEHFE